MFFFINFLRAIATCLITNSHYDRVYPISLMANGGLLGNVLFFAVSGFCLSNVKDEFSIIGFAKWYKKRITRIYLPMTIVTVILLQIGHYKMTESQNLIYWLVFPTPYNFIAAIIILYAPFFVVTRIPVIKDNLNIMILVVFIVAMCVYIIAYDKSTYRIDNVAEPYIGFLYFESMLLGALFKDDEETFHNKDVNFYEILSILLMIIVYFVSKVSFSRGLISSRFQIINQIILYILLYFIFRVSMKADAKLEAIPSYIKKVIIFLSGLTLEIYLVQLFILQKTKDLNIVFPINWMIITSMIIVAAYTLHLISKTISEAWRRILNKSY